MPLQFVLGRAGSGKSEYCVKQAAQAEEKGLRTLMIVPEQYSHQGESAFLNEKGYIHDDFNVTSFGRLAKKLIAGAGLNPVCREFPGWKCDLRAFTRYEDFPAEFKAYVEFIERETGVPVKIISVGPDRGETIVR